MEGYRDNAIDRVRRARERWRKVLGEKAGLEIRNHLCDDVLDVYRIDDGRAQFSHVGYRFVGDADTIAIGKGRLDHQISQNAQPFARKRPFIGKAAVGNLGPGSGRSDGIFGVVSRQSLQHQRDVPYGTAMRPRAISSERQGKYAVPADQTLRSNNSHDVVVVRIQPQFVIRAPELNSRKLRGELYAIRIQSPNCRINGIFAGQWCYN